MSSLDLFVQEQGCQGTDILAALARLRRKVRNIFGGLFPALKRRAIVIHPSGVSKWPAAGLSRSRGLFSVAVPA